MAPTPEEYDLMKQPLIDAGDDLPGGGESLAMTDCVRIIVKNSIGNVIGYEECY